MRLKNFTVFRDTIFDFAENLNVIVGENGTGKSHLLKAAYSAISVNSEWNGGVHPSSAMGAKLHGVFRPDGLGRLVQRAKERRKADLQCKFQDSKLNVRFSFSTAATKEVRMLQLPEKSEEKRPVFLPTRELLTIYPNFTSVYETTRLEFEETWYDTCVLLGAPLARGPREAGIRKLLEPIEDAMGGKVEFDQSGRFYLHMATGGKMEVHLVAEGLRKLAMLARLIATGSLVDKGYLFWDEPEANLNPKIIRVVAQTIVHLAASGIQIFVATHSLFLLRELHILRGQHNSLRSRYIGLHFGKGGQVEVAQGDSIEDIGEIAALDEDLMQSDRYIDAEQGQA